MSSPPRTREREEQRRLNLRTLAIASIASATAAVVTSQFWAGGTPIAAAVTPVIVALVSEMLHRPTEVIARKITTDRPAILGEPRQSRTAHRRESEPSEPPVRIYGRERRPLGRRRKIALGVVATTAVLAFAIAAAALTLPELIAGHSLVKGDRNTTLVPTKRKKSNTSTEQQTTPTSTGQQGTQTTPQQNPQSTTTTPSQTETTTTQTTTTPKGSGK